MLQILISFQGDYLALILVLPYFAIAYDLKHNPAWSDPIKCLKILSLDWMMLFAGMYFPMSMSVSSGWNTFNSFNWMEVTKLMSVFFFFDVCIIVFIKKHSVNNSASKIRKGLGLQLQFKWGNSKNQQNDSRRYIPGYLDESIVRIVIILQEMITSKGTRDFYKET